MGTPDSQLASPPVDETLRVLVVEDDPHLRHGLLRAFPSTIAPLGVASLAEARMRLREEEWNAFVLDVGLPDGKGTDLLQEIRLESAMCPSWSTPVGATLAGAKRRSPRVPTT